jgi:hypothetical protein
MVVKVAQLLEFASVNGAAIGMDELSQLEFVDHLLQYGVGCHCAFRGHQRFRCIVIGSPVGKGRLDELLSLSTHR